MLRLYRACEYFDFYKDLDVLAIDDDKGLLVKDTISGRYYFITISGQYYYILSEVAKELYNEFDQVIDNEFD